MQVKETIPFPQRYLIEDRYMHVGEAISTAHTENTFSRPSVLLLSCEKTASATTRVLR